MFLKTYDDVDVSLLSPDERAKVSIFDNSDYYLYRELLTNYFSLCLTTTGRIPTRYLKNVPQVDIRGVQAQRYSYRTEAVEVASW